MASGFWWLSCNSLVGSLALGLVHSLQVCNGASALDWGRSMGSINPLGLGAFINLGLGFIAGADRGKALWWVGDAHSLFRFSSLGGGAGNWIWVNSGARSNWLWFMARLSILAD